MTLRYEARDGVAIITLNRPEAMNAIDPETAAELRERWRAISQDASVRCVILTGTGTRAFCTGSDLKKTMPPPQGVAELSFGPQATPHLLDGIDAVRVPIICAVNGYALGGGLELALACDIRVAGESARFGLTEVCIGSIPGGAGTQRLPRAIGLSNAMHLLLTGEIVDAAEALRVGLVSRLVPDAELLDAARAIAAKISGNAPLAVAAVKRLVRDGLEMPLDQAVRHEAMVFGVLRDSHDRIEGRKAFQEKRKPDFQGR